MRRYAALAKRIRAHAKRLDVRPPTLLFTWLSSCDLLAGCPHPGAFPQFFTAGTDAHVRDIARRIDAVLVDASCAPARRDRMRSPFARGHAGSLLITSSSHSFYQPNDGRMKNHLLRVCNRIRLFDLAHAPTHTGMVTSNRRRR